MNILYIITILSVYILFMLMHKTEKKQNTVTWLAITFILTICYNILICLICTFLGVLCTLINLSICNIITIAILSIILIKSKKIQKYYLKVQDLIFSILLLIIVIFIGYKQYGFPFNIKYAITDGSSHYFFAQQFYENSTLLYNDTTDDILGLYASDFRLPGAYVNEGILFRVFDGIISKIDLFILFDLFILYLSGILFYQLVKKENKKSNILAMIFSLIYMLGYQLNSMIYGYVYLSLALDIVIGFLLLVKKQQSISNTIALPILALTSFGIFFSYAYFIPIIYIAIIANRIIKSIKSKEKIVSPQNIIELMYIIIIPLILGIAYFIIFPLINGGKTEISTIGTVGVIYENYITNYLPFIPIFIASIILSLKKKEKRENNFAIILFILSIIFAITLWIGNKLEIVSRYYFFKAYYIIWPLAIYNTYIALSYLLAQKNKILKAITYIYISAYIVITILSTLAFQKNIWINNIFYNNEQYIQEYENILESGEVNILKKVENSMQYDDIYILAPLYRGRAAWISVLYHNQLMYIDWMTGYTISIQNWLDEKEEKYYLAYYHDCNELGVEYPSEENNEYNIIYKDEYGFILERK